MPLAPDPFLRWYGPVQAIRRRAALGYLIAIAGVAAATLLRLGLAHLLEADTFTVYFPVIVVAALVGSARTGTLAVVLSALAANLFVIPPTFSFNTEWPAVVATLMFALAASLQVALVVMLNRALDRIFRHADETKQILDAQPVGVMLVDSSGVINFVNKRVEAEVGYGHEELRGRRLEMLLPDTVCAAEKLRIDRYLADPAAQCAAASREFQARRKNGTVIPVEVGLAPFRQQTYSGTLVTLVDISERKALERRELIASEVHHRAANALAVVQALARRTLPSAERKAFLDMLQSLAHTHDVLNGQGTASLHTLIGAELGGFAPQVEVRGPDVRLSATAAQDFALIVHELRTNALKYGALSRPEGRVTVECGREDGGRSLVFLWQERGGPKVAPTRQEGFGSALLKDVAQGFASSVDLNYAEEGLSYALRTELARISELGERPRPARAVGGN